MNKEIYRKYSNKRVNAQKENIEFNLTYEDYVYLLKEAGIEHTQVGNTGYHLARYEDSGPYEKGNCRFIFYTDNLKEKKISEKNRVTGRIAAKKMSENNIINREKWIASIKLGKQQQIKKSSLKKVMGEVVIEKIITVLHKDFSVWGSKTKAAKELGMSRTHLERLLKKFYGAIE